MTNQLVSAVIPTRNRPELLLRAVRSALGQTHQHLEVVVVIDGPDPATRAALDGFSDPRLRVLELSESHGGSGARNQGVEHATGEWVAFLDDDDEWMPTKIEKQLEVAFRSKSPQPIVSCYFIGRTPKGDYIWPRRTPSLNEPLSEYLFMRRSVFFGETQLQTSLTFARKKLLQAVPFTEGLRRHQDTDWYLRVAAHEGVEVEFVHEPLAVWYLGDHRPRITSNNDWRHSLDWLRSRKDLITRRAYAGFVATQLGPEAAQQGDWSAFVPLLREAVIVGDCHPFDILLYFGLWFTPVTLRRNLRSMVRSFSPGRIENVA
jgi:glycosyltransferase involved in cell wall biosynthesis